MNAVEVEDRAELEERRASVLEAHREEVRERVEHHGVLLASAIRDLERAVAVAGLRDLAALDPVAAAEARAQWEAVATLAADVLAAARVGGNKARQPLAARSRKGG